MNRAASRLRADLPEILRTIRLFRVVRPEHVDALVAHLTASLAAQPARTAAAAAARNARSERIAAGIRLAVGALPLDRRGIVSIIEKRIARRLPAFYGLGSVPCAKTIRKVLRGMAAERREKSGHSVNEMTQRVENGVLRFSQIITEDRHESGSEADRDQI